MSWKKITRTPNAAAGTVTVEDVAGPPDTWPPAVDPERAASMQPGSARPMSPLDAILYDVDGVATGYTENPEFIAYYEARV